MIALFAAAVVAVAAPSAADQRMAELQHIYSQSCEVRAYATFDDLCDRLKQQMRQAQRDQKAAARVRPAPAKQALADSPAKD